MSVRFYICPVLGTGRLEGTLDPFDPGDPYRPKVADRRPEVSWSAVIPSDSRGRPRRSWALVLVDAADHGPLLSDPDLHPFPDATLGQKIASLPVTARQQVQARLAQAGAAADAVDMRDAVQRVGRKLDAGFDVAGLGVRAR